MTDREKLIELLCEAQSKATDAGAFDDATYAQQLEMEADHLIANGVTIPVPCKKCVHAQRDGRGELWCWGAMRVFGDYFCANGATPLPEPPKEE